MATQIENGVWPSMERNDPLWGQHSCQFSEEVLMLPRYLRFRLPILGDAHRLVTEPQENEAKQNRFVAMVQRRKQGSDEGSGQEVAQRRKPSRIPIVGSQHRQKVSHPNGSDLPSCQIQKALPSGKPNRPADSDPQRGIVGREGGAEGLGKQGCYAEEDVEIGSNPPQFKGHSCPIPSGVSEPKAHSYQERQKPKPSPFAELKDGGHAQKGYHSRR
jgi:hypothetical protein